MTDDNIAVVSMHTEDTVTAHTIKGIKLRVEVRVCHVGEGKWAVRYGLNCVSAKGTCEYEPSPSNRTDLFLQMYRFTYDEAHEIAKAFAEKELKRTIRMRLSGHRSDYE